MLALRMTNPQFSIRPAALEIVGDRARDCRILAVKRPGGVVMLHRA